jgi:hypothetical protein
MQMGWVGGGGGGERGLLQCKPQEETIYEVKGLKQAYSFRPSGRQRLSEC